MKIENINEKSNKEIKNIIIKNLKWYVLFICVVTFFIIVIDVKVNQITNIDKKVYETISTYLISDNMTKIEIIITNFAGMHFLIGFSILLFLVIKDKKIGISIFLNLLLSALTNFSIKQIFQRPRPINSRIIDESGYSFPSGHSMVSMAFYGYLIYLIHKNIRNKYVKLALNLLLSILIISIGISRIYLGVHYTSDVIAGFLVAISYLIIFINSTKK